MHLPRLLICAALWFSLVPIANAQHWPRFRGPNGAGISTATTIPVKWTAADFNWKVRLPGVGHSSPVVWDQRIFVTSGDNKTGERFLTCIDANDGKTLWQRIYPGEKSRRHADNSLASATPVVDDRHVYVSWGNAREYLVVALDHDGKEIWRKDLGPFKGGHGFGVSPIVHGDILVVTNDQDGPSSLVGLDRHTGATRWTVPRKSRCSYSTPCVYQPVGRPAEVIFCNYEHGVTSVDPKTGKVNWEIDVFDKGHMETSIGSPIVAGDVILAPCGWLSVRHEVVAVRPPGVGGSKEAKKLYDLYRKAPLCTTPLVKDGLVYLWSDKGIVTCADVATGKVHWQERVAGNYYSSPVCTGKYLYNISREGDVAVLEVGKQFKLVARNSLGEGSHSTPALASGRMFVRTFTQLISVGGK